MELIDRNRFDLLAKWKEALADKRFPKRKPSTKDYKAIITREGERVGEFEFYSLSDARAIGYAKGYVTGFADAHGGWSPGDFKVMRPDGSEIAAGTLS